MNVYAAVVAPDDVLARVGGETYARAMTHVSETVELTAASRRPWCRAVTS